MRIEFYQLYNIPLPFLILAELQKNRSFKTSNNVFEALCVLFNRYNKFYASNKRNIEHHFRSLVDDESSVLYSIQYCNNVKNYFAELIEDIKKEPSNESILNFKIPLQRKECPNGMTSQQYSDYVLGYMIVEDVFSSLINIEYY